MGREQHSHIHSACRKKCAETGSIACDTHPRAIMKTAGLINSCALEAVIWQLCNPCRQP